MPFVLFSSVVLDVHILIYCQCRSRAQVGMHSIHLPNRPGNMHEMCNESAVCKYICVCVYAAHNQSCMWAGMNERAHCTRF